MFEQIRELCPVIAGKYKRLKGEKKEIADRGILRHYSNCAKLGCDIDIAAIHEVVNDARNGIAIYEENDFERATAARDEHNSSTLGHVHTVHLLNGLRSRW